MLLGNVEHGAHTWTTASVKSVMWLVLVLLATYVGASSPWGVGIWPRWPAHPEEGRVEQVVTGTLHMLRQDKTQLGQPTVFHHSPVLQRKENVQRGQKETRERYKEPASLSKISYSKNEEHLKLTKVKNTIKRDLSHWWREYERRIGDKRNHLVLRLPTSTIGKLKKAKQIKAQNWNHRWREYERRIKDPRNHFVVKLPKYKILKKQPSYYKIHGVQ